jgi:hypothetical protein
MLRSLQFSRSNSHAASMLYLLPPSGRCNLQGPSWGAWIRSEASRFGVTPAAAHRHPNRCLKVTRRVEPGVKSAKAGLDSWTAIGADSSRFASETTADRCPTCATLSADPDPKALIKRAERLLWLAESIAAKARKDDDARLASQVLIAPDRCLSNS